ncbi:MAG: hypothetical protein ACI9Y7_000201 [Dokdonia sp.]|jgi:hypothetical protein
MIENTQHIIAHCHWNTVFDAKELGVQLQNKVSHWSHYHLSRELTPLFDTICPEGQTLKIDSLEIDLGSIEYDNFEEELPLKLKEILHQKLHDIIMYPHMHGQGLEVVHEDISYIASLKCFLLQGILPWNYKTTDKSIHALFDEQMLHNRSALMDMIQSIGVHQYVRKRIAWQLKEDSIKKIIESLEPSNHNQIFTFYEELSNIQKQETVVKTSLQDFKNNLWFWILNYLFIERGSMFNKMSFVKSNIKQMANHFNVEYYALFELIEEAIYKIHGTTSIKNDLILILVALSKEHKSTNTVPVTHKQTENSWAQLKNFFINPLSRKTTQHVNTFNDLIVYFAKADLHRLRKFLFSSDIKSGGWLQIFKDTRVPIREKIMHVIAPQKATQVIDQIRFFEAIAVQQIVGIEQAKLWDIGIQFLFENHTKVYGEQAFVTHAVTALSTSTHVSKAQVLEKLLQTEVPQFSKTIKTIAVYKALKTMHSDEMRQQDNSFTKERCIIVLNRLKDAIQNHTTDQAVIEELYATITYWIENNAVQIWEILVAYPDKTQIISYLFIIIDAHKTQQFLEKVNYEYATILKDFKDSIALAISQTTSNAQTLKAIQSCITSIGFEVILNQKNGSFLKFVTQMIAQLRVEEGIGTASNFAKAISEIISYFYQRVGDTSLQKLLKKEQETLLQDIEPLRVIAQVMKESRYKQEYVAKLGKTLFLTKEITTDTFKALSVDVQNYLLPNSPNSLEDYVQKYTALYIKNKGTQNTKDIRAVFTHIFWNCLLDYQLYRGDVKRFEILYEKAVCYRFSILKQRNAQATSSIVKPVKYVDNVLKLSEEGIYTYLERCIVASKMAITIDKKEIPFKTILLRGLEQSPKRVRGLIKTLSITKQQREVFIKSIDFEQFISLIAGDVKDQEISQFYKATHALYRLLGDLKTTYAATDITHYFWEQILVLLKGEKTHTEVLKILTRYTLDVLSKEQGISTKFLIKFSQDRRIEIPDLLKRSLVKENIAFENLAVTVQEDTISKDMRHCLKTGKIAALLIYILKYRKIPSWFYTTTYHTTKALLYDIATQYPLQLLSVLRRSTITEAQHIRLHEAIGFSVFIDVLGKLYPRQQGQFEKMKKLYEVVGSIRLAKMSADVVQYILFHKIITAWKTSNWTLLSDTSIWNELLWELCSEKNIQKDLFFKAFDDIKIRLPVSLQITYKQLEKSKKISTLDKTKEHTIKERTMSEQQQSSVILEQGITIHNAGLVIMNTYIAMLFERLGLVKGNAFVSNDARIDAVHYLQYLVTGATQTEEALLVLNKVLCGIPITTPIKEGIEISQDHKTLIQGLIEAAIGYWPAIGQCSIDGFRGNWLVRDGILREEAERWTLTVEKRAYDILMLKSPFSFSIIKLPWMTKPLHVTWSF